MKMKCPIEDQWCYAIPNKLKPCKDCPVYNPSGEVDIKGEYAKICHNCWWMLDHFCLRREAIPTNPSFYKYGCEAYFEPKYNASSHSCLDCKLIRFNYCHAHKKVVDPNDEACEKFHLYPQLKIVHLTLET